MSNPASDIDIIIKTFIRPDCLRRLVDSILSHYPEAHLNIADDGNPDEDERQYYKKLETMGHRVLLLPFNVGLSAGRNRLVEACVRPHLLLLDDDFVFTSQTRIETLAEVLEADPSVGVVGGSVLENGYLNSYKFDMSIEDRLLHLYPIRREARTIAEHSCYDAQIVPNFALFRRRVFETIRWDERLKVREHEDFYLRLAATSWKVVSLPSVIAEHHHPDNSGAYNSFRWNSESEDLLNRKWNIVGFFYHREGDSPLRDNLRVRLAYAGLAVRFLRGLELRNLSRVLMGGAIAEVRRVQRHLHNQRSRAADFLKQDEGAD